MALRLIRTLPGDRAFLPPSLAAFVTPANLASASGGQDHTTSPSAAAPFVRTSKSRASPSRPSHPRPTFRDDAHTPLQSEAGCAHQTTDLGCGQAALRKSEYASCGKLARRAVCAWRSCRNCPPGTLGGWPSDLSIARET